jgi:hypothetical protein
LETRGAKAPTENALIKKQEKKYRKPELHLRGKKKVGQNHLLDGLFRICKED